MSTDKILKSVSVRSEDCENRRMCDLVLTEKGYVYIVDVEHDYHGRKRKYKARLDKYYEELMRQKTQENISY